MDQTLEQNLLERKWSLYLGRKMGVSSEFWMEMKRDLFSVYWWDDHLAAVTVAK